VRLHDDRQELKSLVVTRPGGVEIASLVPLVVCDHCARLLGRLKQ
jgi:hypothetical protein